MPHVHAGTCANHTYSTMRAPGPTDSLEMQPHALEVASEEANMGQGQGQGPYAAVVPVETLGDVVGASYLKDGLKDSLGIPTIPVSSQEGLRDELVARASTEISKELGCSPDPVFCVKVNGKYKYDWKGAKKKVRTMSCHMPRTSFWNIASAHWPRCQISI